MSATNRPTTRWSSSSKASSLINPPTRKKLPQTSVNYQHTFPQRTTKTRHDVEELFKLYYAANVKFDNFQRHVVTGTRIPSAQTTTTVATAPPALLAHYLTNSSLNVFRSKHCVSREDDSPTDIIEPQIINDEPLDLATTKRTVEVRLDHQPIVPPSISPRSDADSIPVNSDINPSENAPLINESTIVKSIEDIPNVYFDYAPLRRSKSTLAQSSIVTLPVLPASMAYRRDLMNLSQTSFSTVNSSQPNMITGSAVLVRERSPSKSGFHKQRIKSTPQPTNWKASSTSLQHSQSEIPLCLATRVVSIPSKCNRYVLVTFPQTPVRYNAPSYVERLLLPERFPTLFHNIVQNRNTK